MNIYQKNLSNVSKRNAMKIKPPKRLTIKSIVFDLLTFKFDLEL